MGSGCKNCQSFHQNVIDALAELNLSVDLEYVTDMQKIMESGAMSMPALMVNEKVVSCGKVFKVDEVKKLLSSRYIILTQKAGTEFMTGGDNFLNSIFFSCFS